ATWGRCSVQSRQRRATSPGASIPSSARALAPSSSIPSKRLLDDGEPEAQQVGDLAHARQLVADPERKVMRRALRAPGVEEGRRAGTEADPRVRVPDPERRPRD